MYLHFICFEIEGNIGHMEKVVSKEFFDHVAFITTQNNEVSGSKPSKRLHYMPKQRSATDVDHGFWAQRGFFADSSAKATG
jgi:hypothetical protein